MFYFQTLYFRILLRCQSRFFSIGTITSYNGTLTNTVEWICCMFPVTTYGGRILSFTISIQHFFSLFFIVPCCFSSPHTYPFQRVSDTNTSKKPDTLVVTHLFFHVKQKKTCTKLVPEKCCHQFRTHLLRIREGNKGRRKTRLKLFSETRQKLQFPPKKLLYSFNPN